MNLSQISIYPVKSLGGIALQEASVEARGLRHDRRWMLVDAENKFQTQREHPKLALVAVAVMPEGLMLTAPGSQPLHVPFVPTDGTPLTVRVWRSETQAVFVGGAADDWCSAYLHHPCRLVYMPESAGRSVNPSYAVSPNDLVSFADGYPIMLLSEASLADLNTRLPSSLSMNRFRPNFVVSGAEAYAEDGWKKITIGKVNFHVVKPCDRCVMTTIDQETAERGIEPMHTLAQYRLVEQKVLFGQYLIPETPGTVRVGDEIIIGATQ